MEEAILGVISDGAIVDNKKQNELMQMTPQLALFYAMKWRDLLHKMTQIVWWIIFFNAVGVVLLIAQGC